MVCNLIGKKDIKVVNLKTIAVVIVVDHQYLHVNETWFKLSLNRLN